MTILPANFVKLPKRPTSVKLVDVAAAAQVSLATASRALSNPALVRPETLRKVREAVDLLGYVPHGAARALASHRTRTIGAVFPPVDNPIFATGTRALAQELSAAGYTLLLATHDYDAQEELDAVRRLIERGVDGLVLVGLRHEPALYGLLRHSEMPYELTWSLDQTGAHYSVGIAHREAAAQITRHLLALGHREFAVIAGMLEANDRAQDRMDGVFDALSEVGLSLPAERLIQAEFLIAKGREAFDQLHARAPGFSAVICGNDILAIGAVKASLACGISVPEQMSIVGFDDIEMADAVTPGLTTMQVPSAQIGRAAAVRLLARLAGQEVPRSQAMVANLVLRGTTGPAGG